MGWTEKEKVHLKLYKEAVETLLSEEGVSTWMERLGSAREHIFKNPRVLEGMKPVQYLINEVTCTIWDKLLLP